MRYSLRIPRTTDNIAIIGKSIAVLLSLATILISGYFILLIPFSTYALGLYLFAKKTALKGKLMIWSLPYEMKSWDQAAIDSSRLSIIAASSTLMANATMIILSFSIYQAR